VIDGTSNVVADTATATPDDPPAISSFIPATAFPPPLALTYATTQGADVSWVPMGFTRSLAVAHGHSDYGTGYFIYSLYDASTGAPMSQPIGAWAETDAPPADVLALLPRLGPTRRRAGQG